MGKTTKLIDSEDYDIRYTNLNDLPYLLKWLKTKGMIHWFPPADNQELENFARIWVSFSRYNCSLTAVYKEQPVGIATLFLMPYRKVAHHCMFQIIVDPELHRKGIGSSLMKNLKHMAKTQFKQEIIHGEILDENRIIYLLKNQGFVEFARQEKYMKEGDQYFPRILMECNLL